MDFQTGPETMYMRGACQLSKPFYSELTFRIYVVEVFLKENVRNPVWTCRDPNRVSKTPLKNPNVVTSRLGGGTQTDFVLGRGKPQVHYWLQRIYHCDSSQGHNEVRWRPGQEASLVPPFSNLRFFRKQMYCIDESSCAVVGTFRRPHNDRAPGKSSPLRYSLDSLMYNNGCLEPRSSVKMKRNIHSFNIFLGQLSMQQR